MSAKKRFAVATLGSGCFWCTQAVFNQLRGVREAVCGYSGGAASHPSYEQVCTGDTGHAECVQLTFDPAEITYADLLQVFFQTHDPTTLNRQGNDVGTQYRSVIFYHDEDQQKVAQQTIQDLNKAHAFDAKIVTQVEPAGKFYEAEPYHQDYFSTHPKQPYCAAVIRPKLDTFVTKYRDLLK